MKPITNFLLQALVWAMTALSFCIPTGSFSATTVDTTALRSSFGNYYADASKNLTDLYAKVFETAEFDSLFAAKKTTLTTWRSTVTGSSSLTQAFQHRWTPNGSFSFVPSETPLQMVKVDLELNSYDVYDSFVGFLHEQNKPQDAQLYAKYILDTLVLNQHVEDVELNGCYKGVYVSPTPGTAGSVGAMINGWKYNLNAKITATTVTPISTPTVPIDAEDYVTYIEDMFKQVDTKDRDREMTLAVNKDHELLFKEGMELKYNSQFRNTTDLMKLKHFQNATVKGFKALGSSDKVFCSPTGNLVKPYNVGVGPFFNFEVVDRTLKVWTDHSLGYGSIDDSRVYTNSADL